MRNRPTRIAVIGHFTYFENHFPERWALNADVLCLDVSEDDYRWMIAAANFRPDLTLFYRPELYPRRYVERIPGVRVALLSEPLPAIRGGQLEFTDETRLRQQVYAPMAWDAYHWRIFYDEGKKESAAMMGYSIDEYRPLPIDISLFRAPHEEKRRPFDVTFLGKATPHRIARMDFLRSSNLKFLWVAHGASGRQLAEVFRRSKLVLNIHADGQEAFEPRLYLAAACGAGVLSEPLSSTPIYFRDRIWEHLGDWNRSLIRQYLTEFESLEWTSTNQADLEFLSTRRLIEDVWSRFAIAAAQ
mgnify:CR=1 FL=1